MAELTAELSDPSNPRTSALSFEIQRPGGHEEPSGGATVTVTILPRSTMLATPPADHRREAIGKPGAKPKEARLQRSTTARTVTGRTTEGGTTVLASPDTDQVGGSDPGNRRERRGGGNGERGSRLRGTDAGGGQARGPEDGTYASATEEGTEGASRRSRPSKYVSALPALSSPHSPSPSPPRPPSRPPCAFPGGSPPERPLGGTRDEDGSSGAPATPPSETPDSAIGPRPVRHGRAGRRPQVAPLATDLGAPPSPIGATPSPIGHLPATPSRHVAPRDALPVFPGQKTGSTATAQARAIVAGRQAARWDSGGSDGRSVGSRRGGRFRGMSAPLESLPEAEGPSGGSLRNGEDADGDACPQGSPDGRELWVKEGEEGPTVESRPRLRAVVEEGQGGARVKRMECAGAEAGGGQVGEKRGGALSRLFCLCGRGAGAGPSSGGASRHTGGAAEGRRAGRPSLAQNPSVMGWGRLDGEVSGGHGRISGVSSMVRMGLVMRTRWSIGAPGDGADGARGERVSMRGVLRNTRSVEKVRGR